MTREQALAMWTREAARVLRWERIGSLEPGHHADLVVIDPLTCPIEDPPGDRSARDDARRAIRRRQLVPQ